MVAFISNFGFDPVWLVEEISFVEFQYWFLNSFKLFARQRQYMSMTLLGSIATVFEKDKKKGIFEHLGKEMLEIDKELGEFTKIQTAAKADQIFNGLLGNIMMARRK